MKSFTSWRMCRANNLYIPYDYECNSFPTEVVLVTLIDICSHCIAEF